MAIVSDELIVVNHDGQQVLVVAEVANNLDIVPAQDITDEQRQNIDRAHRFLALCEKDQRNE